VILARDGKELPSPKTPIADTAARATKKKKFLPSFPSPLPPGAQTDSSASPPRLVWAHVALEILVGGRAWQREAARRAQPAGVSLAGVEGRFRVAIVVAALEWPLQMLRGGAEGKPAIEGVECVCGRGGLRRVRK